jgi:F420-dependent oxidoreductase-like protein
MNLGLQINRFTWPDGDKGIGPKLAEIVKTADDAGFYSVWVMDHFFQIDRVGAPEEPMLEAYTTLGYIAALTKKVKLGTMVTGVIYRNPALLIKAVSALDVISGGRAYLGIGAAWNDYESESLGFNFPPVKERFEMLEETLQIALQMWKGDETPFHGKHFNMERPMNSPQVLSKPHPPILIGGGGEQKTLKFVAKYGDACNLFAQMGDEEVQHKLDVLKKHCQDVGRNYDEIEKTALWQIRDEAVDPEAIIETAKHLKEMGFDQMIVGIRKAYEIEPLKIFGEKIIPEVSKL